MVADRKAISIFVMLLLATLAQLNVAVEAVENSAHGKPSNEGQVARHSRAHHLDAAASSHGAAGHSGSSHARAGTSEAGRTGKNHARATASGASTGNALKSPSEARRSNKDLGRETRFVSVLVRDRHGRLRRLVKEESISGKAASAASERGTNTGRKGGSPSRFHIEKRRVVIVTRDRHGRLHRTTRIESVRVVDQKEGQGSAAQKVEGKGQENDDEPKEVVHVSPNFSKTYALYDQGVNARLSKEYQAAISDLGRALDMVPENDHGGISVLQLNMEYDLAMAAEQKGDFSLAARYYARAVADRANFTEASVRLATVLAKSGNYAEALKAARAGVEHSPGDPRTHAVLAVILAKMGQSAQANFERQKTATLLANPSNIHLPPDAVVPVLPNQNVEPAGSGVHAASGPHDETQEMIPTEAPMPQTENAETEQPAAREPNSNALPGAPPGGLPSALQGRSSITSSGKGPGSSSELEVKKTSKQNGQAAAPANPLPSAPTPGPN
jgi:tetratricopeptide (TPR) repeat protein